MKTRPCYDIYPTKYSNLILTHSIVLCVVLSGVLIWFQPPTAKLHIKKLASIVKGPQYVLVLHYKSEPNAD